MYITLVVFDPTDRHICEVTVTCGSIHKVHSLKERPTQSILDPV